MTGAGWASSVCVFVVIVFLAVVALDRNRLKHRLDIAEGSVTGLVADLDATRDQVTRLQAYLGVRSSWEVDASPPPSLTATADRWSPLLPKDAAKPTVVGVDDCVPAPASAPVSAPVLGRPLSDAAGAGSAPLVTPRDAERPGAN